jgi:hypothetical protein
MRIVKRRGVYVRAGCVFLIYVQKSCGLLVVVQSQRDNFQMHALFLIDRNKLTTTLLHIRDGLRLLHLREF